ncbi:MAG: acyl-CoA dehydrogenase family protein [Dehalococcoidia bacterium]
MATGANIADELRALGERLAAREAENPDDFSRESFDDIKRAGLHLAPLAPSFGGRGWTLAEATAAVETLARFSPSAALLAAMPLGLAGIYGVGVGCAPEDHREAWAEQMDGFAADARGGVWYAACNSEKGAGGSLEATRTVATRGSDGVFRLTGEKILASSGKHADRFFSTARVSPEDLPGAGVVEVFFVATDAPGVQILSDWDGFGMRPTESQTVRFDETPALGIMGFPDFLATVQPLPYWFCLFAAIPLGCAASILEHLATPTPQSPALRLRFSEAQMRIEAMRAYLGETAAQWRACAGPGYAARVLRTKTYVSQEATKLSAELFALGGGRHYRRTSPVARALADSFAGTALRPPLALALDTLIENFAL